MYPLELLLVKLGLISSPPEPATALHSSRCLNTAEAVHLDITAFVTASKSRGGGGPNTVEQRLEDSFPKFVLSYGYCGGCSFLVVNPDQNPWAHL